MLDIEKANKVLGWKPVYKADEAIKNTVEWYKKFYNNEKILEFSIEQIMDYQKRTNEGDISEKAVSTAG